MGRYQSDMLRAFTKGEEVSSMTGISVVSLERKTFSNQGLKRKTNEFRKSHVLEAYRLLSG